MARILVIEDEESILENILETLELHGYEAVGASDGRRGTQLAQERLPDLVVCDILMPGMDGYGVLQALRSSPATARVPFIFLTAKSDRGDLRQGMELGADDYITKPFQPSELIAAIQTRLQRQAAIDQEYEKKLDDLRDSIIHMLPHELRTPLTSIVGYSEILVLDGPEMERERIVEMAEAIHRAGERLRRLIENYLIYAQLEIISADPERTVALRSLRTLHPAQAIESAARQKAQAANRAADLVLDVVDTGTVQIASDNLTKIVEELVDNAFKFSSVGTPVQVTARPEDATYVLSVQDYGRGMLPEHVASIGAYMQFGRKLHEQQGSGLGLVIAKRLVELHGGELVIESVAGQHTSVRVALPL